MEAHRSLFCSALRRDEFRRGIFTPENNLARPDYVFWASPTQPSPLITLTLGFLYKYGPLTCTWLFFTYPLAATSQLHFFSTPSLLLAPWRSAAGLLHGRRLPPLRQTRGAQDASQGNQQLKTLSALSSSLAAKPSHGALLPQCWYKLSPPWQRLPKLLSPAMVGARRCSLACPRLQG
jgi:hypothetical protein